MRSCAALRRLAAICTRKSLFRQTSTNPTQPQQLTSQSSLEPFRLLVTRLVCSRRQARQPTRCEEGTRSVRHVFGGGRCGGAAPAQGRPLAADRPKYNNVGRKNTLARLVQGCVSVAAESLRLTYNPLDLRVRLSALRESRVAKRPTRQPRFHFLLHARTLKVKPDWHLRKTAHFLIYAEG